MKEIFAAEYVDTVNYMMKDEYSKDPQCIFKLFQSNKKWTNNKLNMKI